MIKKIIAISLSFIGIITVCYLSATITNTKQITSRQEILKNSKHGLNDETIQIVYFSDLYYTNFIDSEFLNNAINKINLYKPEIIIFGGDLIDKSKSSTISSINKEELIQALKSLDAKYGKYAVLGENDDEQAIDVLKQADFKVLSNESFEARTNKDNVINIIGINSNVDDIANCDNAFIGVNQNNYTLVVAHHPDTLNNVINQNFDYMLAGHTRGGQIYFPIISLFSRDYGCKEFFRGKHTKSGKTLDITNGLGRTKYNARFLADSEIVAYRLSITSSK